MGGEDYIVLLVGMGGKDYIVLLVGMGGEDYIVLLVENLLIREPLVPKLKELYIVKEIAS